MKCLLFQREVIRNNILVGSIVFFDNVQANLSNLSKNFYISWKDSWKWNWKLYLVFPVIDVKYFTLVTYC